MNVGEAEEEFGISKSAIHGASHQMRNSVSGAARKWSPAILVNGLRLTIR